MHCFKRLRFADTVPAPVQNLRDGLSVLTIGLSRPPALTN